MRRIASLVFIALVFALATVPSQAMPEPGVLSTGWGGEEATQGQLSSVLTELARLYSEGKRDEAATLALGRGATMVGDSVRVVVEARDDRVGQVLAWVRDQSLELQTSHENRLQVIVPVNRLADVAALPGIAQVRLPYRPLPLLTGQGVTVTQANTWQTAGFLGSGVKVAVFDLGFSGYQSLVASGELPTNVVARSFRSDGDISAGEVHGSACAEIIHDMAPGAQLYLLNLETDVDFGNAVDWAMSQGVQVASCSLAWLGAGTFEGDGPVCDDVNRARNAGIFWAQSAGNAANKHWEGDWSDSDADDLLNFSGSDELLTFYASAGTTIYANLVWDEPWGAAGNDYDLFLYNDSDDPVASSTDPQTGNGYPSEFISYYAGTGGNYHLAVKKELAPDTPRLEIYSFRQSFEYLVPGSSLMTPADAEGAVAAGATYWQTDGVESFSSRGPSNDGRLKPEFAAPDGVYSAAYGGSFFGTSAAAPHLAGAAALARSLYPAFSVTDTVVYLAGRAVDLQTPGPDYLTGYGRLSLGGVPSQPTVTPTPSATASSAPDLVTLGGAQDTYVYQYAPTTSYCADDRVKVGYKQQNAGLVRFDVSSIPLGATVVSATLQLYATSWSGAGLEIGAYYISRTVSSCQATWSQASTGNPWGTAGGNDVTTDCRPAPESQLATTGPGVWYAWPLTQVVQGWVSGSLANNGVLLRAMVLADTDLLYLASAENANSSIRPRLVVYYVGGGGAATPTETATLTATHTPTPVASYTPTATASATGTFTPTPTAVATQTATRTPTLTVAATSTATWTATPTDTVVAATPSATATSSGAPVMVTLSGAQDTYLYLWADWLNYCGDALVKVGDKQRYNGLVRFDVSSIPADAEVISATLQGYSVGWGGADLQIGVYYITRTVAVCQSTWGVASTGNAWGTGGCNNAVTDRRGIAESAATTLGIGRWYVWPVTGVVQGWVSGALANNGVLLRGGSSILSNQMSFASAENGNTSIRPRLVVYYVGGGNAATPTSTPTATPTATHTPTLVVSHTPTSTASATRTFTPTPTAVATQTATRTSMATLTLAATNTATRTATPTDTVVAATPSATATSSGAPVMVTLSGAQDTYLYLWADWLNYCGDTLVKVGDKQRYNGLVRFDVSSIPADAEVISATLQGYSVGWGGADLQIGVYYITRTVAVCQSTWGVASTGNAWGIGGCNNVTTDRRGAAESAVTTEGIQRWYTWSLTNVVQGWVSGALANNGVLLRGGSSTLSNQMSFASAENANGSLRPRLVVYYVGGGGAATATLTATHTPTPAESYTPTATATQTRTPTNTPTGTATPTVTLTSLPTSTPTKSATPTQTLIPTATPTVVAGVEITVTLQQGASGYAGASDTYIYRYAETQSYSTSTTIRVGGSERYASLIRFGLSVIPSNAVVTRASLQMYAAAWSGYNVGMGAHVISRTVNLNETTWQRSGSSELWGTAGCENIATDRRALYESPVMTSGTGKWYSFPVAAAVQAWVNGDLSNNGLVLRGEFGSYYTGTVYFASSENGTTSIRPRLQVTYYIPGGPAPLPSLVIGHITDVHVGSGIQLDGLVNSLQILNGQAQVLIDTGDCAHNDDLDLNKRDSIAYWEMVASNVTIPWRAAPGNHDTPQNFPLYIGPMEWSYDIGAYRLIGIDFEDIDWPALDQALTMDRICIVFGHLPLDYYGEETQMALRQRFVAYNVPLYVSGHTHEDSYTSDPETGTQLLVGRYGSLGSYRLITLQGPSISVTLN